MKCAGLLGVIDDQALSFYEKLEFDPENPEKDQRSPAVQDAIQVVSRYLLDEKEDIRENEQVLTQLVKLASIPVSKITQGWIKQTLFNAGRLVPAPMVADFLAQMAAKLDKKELTESEEAACDRITLGADSNHRPFAFNVSMGLFSGVSVDRRERAMDAAKAVIASKDHGIHTPSEIEKLKKKILAADILAPEGREKAMPDLTELMVQMGHKEFIKWMLEFAQSLLAVT